MKLMLLLGFAVVVGALCQNREAKPLTKAQVRVLAAAAVAACGLGVVMALHLG